MEEQGSRLKTSVEGQLLTVEGDGDWTVTRSAHHDGLFGGFLFDGIRNVTFDVSGLTALDRAGANIIHRTKTELDKRGIATELVGLDTAFKPLLTIFTEADDQLHEAVQEEPHFILAMFERV
ncbi:MAG: STAS domain-containing protein, partial [Pseudomonadota bacterium]|nr:STAS domain-containing protein [Pseudomonadota bacterium]